MIAGFDRPACRLSVRAAIAILIFHVSYIISYFFRLVKRNLTNHLQIRQLFRHFTQFFLKTVPLLLQVCGISVENPTKRLQCKKGCAFAAHPCTTHHFIPCCRHFFQGNTAQRLCGIASGFGGILRAVRLWLLHLLQNPCNRVAVQFRGNL